MCTRKEINIVVKNQKLFLFRKKLNFSTLKMAKIIGISKSYYEKIEYGQRSPSYNFLTKFKKSFPDASIEQIFSFKNDLEPQKKENIFINENKQISLFGEEIWGGNLGRKKIQREEEYNGRR